MTDTLALPDSPTGPRSVEATIVKRYGTAAAATGQDVQTILKRAAEMRNAGLMPSHIRTPEAAVAIALKGAELGIPLMQAWASCFVLQGRVSMEAKMMVGLAYRRLPAFDVVIVKLTREGCTLKGRRSPQHSWAEVTYDEGDAKAAGLLNKTNWNAHPKAMFLARAQAMLCRMVAPDTFSGLYTPEEITEGFAVEEGEALEPAPEIPAEVVDVTPEADPYAHVNAMTAQDVKDRIRDDGLGAEAKRAQATLKIPDADRGKADNLRAIYREILRKMDEE